MKESTNSQHLYSIRSGVAAVVSDNIVIQMGDDGQYQATSTTNTRVFDDPAVLSVDAMSDDSPDEDQMGAELFGHIPGIKHHLLLGYYQDLYAGHVLEGDYRAKGSSGGVATWILKELLEQRKIDGVIHMKTAPAKSGKLFTYQLSRTTDEITSGAKSRYYPGELSASLRHLKKLKGKYAIVGIPSIIMEVRLLAKQDPAINRRIAYTIGLICGHQKSATYAENIAWQSGIKPGNLLAIDFRKKIDGRPSNDYITEITGLVDGETKTIVKSQSELFGTVWGHGFFKTQFSDYTDDTLNETADVSLGDAWLDEYIKDSGGNNIVIVRNSDIADIIRRGIRDKKLRLDRIDEATVVRSQSGLIHHTRDELPYRLYLRDRRGEWRPKKRVSASSDFALLRKLVQRLRMRISHQSHIHYAEAVRRDDWQYFYRKMRPYTKLYSLLYNILLIQKIGYLTATKKIAQKPFVIIGRQLARSRGVNNR